MLEEDLSSEEAANQAETRPESHLGNGKGHPIQTLELSRWPARAREVRFRSGLETRWLERHLAMLKGPGGIPTVSTQAFQHQQPMISWIALMFGYSQLRGNS
jgi:hypothetical protein